MAQSLPRGAFKSISWREGSNKTRSGRFAAVRMRTKQWRLIEWPAKDAEPSKYFLSTLPEEASIKELASAAHQLIAQLGRCP